MHAGRSAVPCGLAHQAAPFAAWRSFGLLAPSCPGTLQDWGSASWGAASSHPGSITSAVSSGSLAPSPAASTVPGRPLFKPPCCRAGGLRWVMAEAMPTPAGPRCGVPCAALPCHHRLPLQARRMEGFGSAASGGSGAGSARVARHVGARVSGLLRTPGGRLVGAAACSGCSWGLLHPLHPTTSLPCKPQRACFPTQSWHSRRFIVNRLNQRLPPRSSIPDRRYSSLPPLPAGPGPAGPVCAGQPHRGVLLWAAAWRRREAAHR